MSSTVAATQPAVQPANPLQTSPIAGRLASLDIMRGLTILYMILVNDPGNHHAVYESWMKHAEWNGWTPPDIGFPAFLFMMGVSIVFSTASRLAKGAQRGELLRHAVRRSVILFGIGIFLNLAPEFHFGTFRVMGVLQRIAIVYLGAVLITLYSSRRGRLLWMAGILGGYWLLLTRVPVPGFGAGVLTPEGNLASYIDRTLLYNHLWIEHVRDPEGLLSSIPAIVTCLIGVFCGEWLRSTASSMRKLGGMVGSGLVLIAAGEVWGHYFVLNKNLWTSSFVLLSGGYSLLVMALLYWVVDIRGWRKWGWPWTMYGRNAISIYFMSVMLAHLMLAVRIKLLGRSLIFKPWAYNKFYVPYFDPKLASFLWAMTFVCFWVLVAWWMDRKRLYIKV